MPPSTASRVDTRTRALAERVGHWVLPYWLERQTDLSSPSFTPSPGTGPVLNAANRDCAPVGTLESDLVATVDPRGLVTPWPGGWSLDWWIGADDRWHLPSREVAVRQALLGDAPVVETSMRVPGGDVIERVWAFHDASAGDVLAIEIENGSRVPVAVALAVRPYGVEGASAVGSIVVEEGPEPATARVVVDGRLAMWLPKVPAHLAMSTYAEGDVAVVVTGGHAGSAREGSVTCPDGLAQAAMVFPLAYTATLRVLVPLGAVAASESMPMPTAVPPTDAVARGWTSHSGRGTRVEIPDPGLAAAFGAARNQVLLASAARSLATDGISETVALVGALGRCGLGDEAAAIVATVEQGQQQGGRLGGDDDSPSATGAVLHATAVHWALGRDAILAAALAGPLAAGAHHRPGTGRIGRRGAAPLGPVAAAWQLAGALGAASTLAGIGELDAADEIRRRVGDLRSTVDAALVTEVLRNPATDPLPLLDLIAPLSLVAPRSTAAAVLVERIRATAIHDGAVVQRRGAVGLSPERTARLAQVELRRGERSALDRLRWLVDAGGPTRTWPELVHPRLGGLAGPGWSAAAAAAVVEAVLDLFAHVVEPEEGPVELVLCAVLPDEWLGAGFEVHDLPTPIGLVSYGVRWHGERPALLWDITPHDGIGEVRVSSPGLDPTWGTIDLRGDALLERPPSAKLDVGPDEPVGTAEDAAAPPPVDSPVQITRRPPSADGSFS
ncbi:MAG: hypothetical protein JJE52_02605 [Acidimicrobiia bacterium]|nr:hypothetical protein [Acidimicrobiia bacterium]